MKICKLVEIYQNTKSFIKQSVISMFKSGLSNVYSKQYYKVPILNYSNLKYKLNFQPNIALNNYDNLFGSNTGGTAYWSGIDSSTGYGAANLSSFLGNTTNYQLTIVPYTNFSTDPQAVIEHGIVDGIGPFGSVQKLLRYNFKDLTISGGTSAPPQSWFTFSRNTSGGVPPGPLQKFYYNFYFKLDPDLDERLIFPLVGTSGSHWFTFSDFKTGGYLTNTAVGDYRFTINVQRDADGLYYRVAGDNNANGVGVIPGLSSFTTYWRQRTASGVVRLGEWQKLEVFISRPVDKDDVTTGVMWVAITPVSTGIREVIGYKIGNTQMGIENLPFCRLFLMGHYSGGVAPIITDYTGLEWRDDFPYSPSVKSINNIMYDY